jgi:hypothetical protein
MIGVDMAVSFGGGLPVLVAGDLNAKHGNWKLRLSTRRGNSYVTMPTRTPN